GQMGVDGAVGHVVEYAGPAIARLSMEGRMTVCNMTIEGGGRAGMVAPDDTTFAGVEGRPAAPKGAEFDAAVERWRELHTAEAEREGLDDVFRSAGFDWRAAGCSMCLGMNPDILSPGERCASTSNRNFEGRQGRGGRTHLVSPEMAAAAAIEGHFVDIREWE